MKFDENHPRLVLDKGSRIVLDPVSVAEVQPAVMYVDLTPNVEVYNFEVIWSTPPVGVSLVHENEANPSAVAQVSALTFHALNFSRVEKQASRCEAQLE